MTLIIAHRGGADVWPENTLPAFDGAIAAGADGAELDVHLTRDGEVVVFHDEALKPEIVRGPEGRWLDAPGPLLKTLSWAELQAYDVGRLKPGTAYAARHPDQQPKDGARIPRLDDVIALAAARSERFQLWIELKTDLLQPERGADPEQLAETALACVRKARFEHRTVFVSFDWRALKTVKALAPDIPAYATTLPGSWFSGRADESSSDEEMLLYARAVDAGAPWLLGLNPRDHGGWPQTVGKAGLDGWFPHYSDITASAVHQARSQGLNVAAWTVPSHRHAAMEELGIDAICADQLRRSDI